MAAPPAAENESLSLIELFDIWSCLFAPILGSDETEPLIESAREVAIRESKALCKITYSSLRKVDKIIHDVAHKHYQHVLRKRGEGLDWYEEEATWYNTNRRHIWRALCTALDLYAAAHGEDTTNSQLVSASRHLPSA